MNKIDYNKKMVGQDVVVTESKKEDWFGRVVDILSEEVFLVENKEGKTFSKRKWFACRYFSRSKYFSSRTMGGREQAPTPCCHYSL